MSKPGIILAIGELELLCSIEEWEGSALLAMLACALLLSPLLGMLLLLGSRPRLELGLGINTPLLAMEGLVGW